MTPPHKFTKQRKPLPKGNSVNQQSPHSSEGPSVAFDQDKFEDEVNWCVFQLKHTLSTHKLADKKGLELVNGLGALQNPKVAMIKKRQIMRSLLGDYREKMNTERNKVSSVGVAAKIIKQQDVQKSKLLKTAARRAALSSKPLSQCNFKMVPTGNVFRFAFPHQTPEISPRIASSVPPARWVAEPANFRFNFSQDQENS